MDDQITGIIGWLGFALVSMGYYFNAKKNCTVSLSGVSEIQYIFYMDSL